jgi:hypothetical protein
MKTIVTSSIVVVALFSALASDRSASNAANRKVKSQVEIDRATKILFEKATIEMGKCEAKYWLEPVKKQECLKQVDKNVEGALKKLDQ